ncbi:unnamed protein product [Aphanomyces euteiches]
MDKYARIRAVGDGSFGTVYLMREKRDGGRLVCVKDIPVSPYEKVHESLHEARLMEKLHHPNIIEYYDSILSRNHRHVFIVMAYCSGGDLHAKLCSKRKLVSETTICLWFVQICFGLHCMHAHRIVHRSTCERIRPSHIHERSDVKSHNIFISTNGHLVLGDLGIARELEPSELAQTFVGTPCFLSPEVYQGSAYAYSSDIWSLGCVLYEMCTLHFPFVAKTTPALVDKICSGHVDPIDRQYSPNLRHLLSQLLSVQPSGRPSLRDILSRDFLRPALECYVTDVLKCCTKSHADIVQRQLGQLGLSAIYENVRLKTVKQDNNVTTILPPNRLVPTHSYKLEQDMLSWLEKERQRHLLLVLARIKEARCDQLRISPRPPSPTPGISIPESPSSPRHVPPLPDPQWRPPVQVDPFPRRQAASKPRTNPSKTPAFRKGVNLTPQAKPFLAQACKDVRALRREAYEAAAKARYRTTTSELLASPPKEADSIEDVAMATPAEIDEAMMQYQRDVERKLLQRDERHVFPLDTCIAVPPHIDAKYRERCVLQNAALAHRPTDVIPMKPTYSPKVQESAQARTQREKARQASHRRLVDQRTEERRMDSNETRKSHGDPRAILVHLDLDAIAKKMNKTDEVKMSKASFMEILVSLLKTRVAMEELDRLFVKIDHDQDGCVTWTEFTDFVLDVMRGQSDRRPREGMHEFDKTPIVAPAMVNRSMDKMVSTDDGSFLALEHRSNVFQVVDAVSGTVRKISSPCTRGYLIDLALVPPLNYIAASTSNTTIEFWDVDELVVRQQLPTTQVQSVVRWNSTRLYTGSLTGEVQAWNCETLDCTGVANLHEPTAITDMTFLGPQPHAVVAAFLPEIAVLDLTTHKPLLKLQGHRSGVSFLRYSPSYRYVLSGGMDHDLRLWSPFMGESIARLSGHQHQIMGLTWVDDSPEVHSADEGGFLKIWDLRTYQCVQTLSTLGFSSHLSTTAITHTMESSKPSVVRSKPTSAMCHLRHQQRIVLASAQVKFYDAVKHDFGDKTAPTLVVFLPSILAIVTATGQNVRTWNAQTGQLMSDLKKIAASQIASGCAGGTSAVFLGTRSGHVFSLHALSGAILLSRDIHASEVIAIEKLDVPSLASRLVTAAIDGSCVVSDASSLAPLLALNHWHGINGFASTRTETTPCHDYYVPLQTARKFSTYALDNLKRFFSALDTNKRGFITSAQVPEVFNAVVSLNHRQCRRHNVYLEQIMAKLGDNNITFLNFLEMIHDTWHGTGYATSEVTAIGISQQHNFVITASVDGHFCIWHGSKGHAITASSQQVQGGITSVAVLEPHPIFAVADDHTGLSLFMLKSLRLERLANVAMSCTFTSLAWCSPRNLIAGDDEGHVTNWHIDGFFTEQPWQVEAVDTKSVSPTKWQQFKYSMGGALSEEASWPAHDGTVFALWACFIHGNGYVATCGGDGFVRVWDLDEENLVGTLVKGSKENALWNSNLPWRIASQLPVEDELVVQTEAREAEYEETFKESSFAMNVMGIRCAMRLKDALNAVRPTQD